MLSNLPPGCTNAMIEAQCSDEPGYVGRDAEMEVNRIVFAWNGYDTHVLIADILEATEEDFTEVLAMARGELELRREKRRKAGK